MVEEADAGVRLDKLLSARVPGLSRGGARELLERGAVWINGKRCKIASRLLRPGEAVEVAAEPSSGGSARASGRAKGDEVSPAEPRVLFEDLHLLVVDKPHAMLTAPTREGDQGTLAFVLSRRSGERLPMFVVHRLDLGTSGLLVFAKTPFANAALAEAFRVHDVAREYRALVHGAADEPFEVDSPVGGKRALTRFSPLERLGRCSLLCATLETGRTHQVRIHAAATGLPVVGDAKHGDRALDRTIPRTTRMFLHAARLGFVHPVTGDRLAFESPLPPELEGLLARLRAPG